MVLTAYSALSLVTGLVCHHRLADTSATLDASVGASGPHDFAVRKSARSSVAPLASIASRLASVTIAIRPSMRRDGGGCRRDLGQKRTEIFLKNALDDPNQIELLQQITLRAQPPRRKESADCRSPGANP
jgi:hypothetical protein